MPIRILGILIAVSTLLTLPSVVSAADVYPTKPLRIIVATSPGGSNDFVARMIGAKLSERFGKHVVVFNRPGGGGVIGYELGAQANPDGYTLVLASASYAALPATHKMPYDPIKAFVPIAKLGTGPFLLIVNSSVPARSVKELIALAKQRPGELNMASGNIGTAPHLGTELFLRLTGIDVKVIPFKGGGPALINILGGHSDASFSNIIQAMPHIKSGRLRALGTGGSKRSVVLPDVPTVADAAGLPGYENANWWSFLAPAGTPAPIVGRLANELKAILALTEVKKWFVNAGGDVDYLGGTEFGRFMAKEIAKFKRIAKDANIKLQ
ncbi:MAG: tripartite tricarboxylate transporter substrate binding protein [Betaproteobacteria bacterium]|nr:tripartite tricarboxylate transporter substrate binding protein [Gammaproteobacteria bacterium]MDH3437741.1 tripartite tricarboxylate transporter substrate binding protein [Betaproteobacteria bacterium]